MNWRPSVILYNPRASFFDMPLAMLALGSALDSERFDVLVVDGRLDKDPVVTISARLHSALCVGISVITGTPILDALKVSQQLKAIRPDVPIIWGGWHPSLFPENPLREHDCIDITVQGQGEQTFREITDCLATGRSLEHIQGICYRENGQIRLNPRRELLTPEIFDRVNYDLIDVETYFSMKGRRQLDYIASTGCNFRCTFCAEPRVNRRRYFSLSPERMVEDLVFYHQKYQFDDINFQDETFFTSCGKLVEFSEVLIRSGLKISWAATMRADQGSRMSDHEWKICRKSGLRRLLIGAESGCQDRLDALKKDIRLEQVMYCAEKCKSMGLAAIFPFIVGFRDETEESFRASVQMAKSLKRMSPLFETPLFFFKPYPGAEATEKVFLDQYSMPASTQEWGTFDFRFSSGPWVSKQKRKIIKALNFYLRAAYGPEHGLIFRPFVSISRWRVRHNCFVFPLEIFLYSLLKK